MADTNPDDEDPEQEHTETTQELELPSLLAADIARETTQGGSTAIIVAAIIAGVGAIGAGAAVLIKRRQKV